VQVKLCAVRIASETATATEEECMLVDLKKRLKLVWAKSLLVGKLGNPPLQKLSDSSTLSQIFPTAEPQI